MIVQGSHFLGNSRVCDFCLSVTTIYKSTGTYQLGATMPYKWKFDIFNQTQHLCNFPYFLSLLVLS
jgi:hypothetical protein